jgi:hypothetical protein
MPQSLLIRLNLNATCSSIVPPPTTPLSPGTSLDKIQIGFTHATHPKTLKKRSTTIKVTPWRLDRSGRKCPDVVSSSKKNEAKTSSEITATGTILSASDRAFAGTRNNVNVLKNCGNRMMPESSASRRRKVKTCIEVRFRISQRWRRRAGPRCRVSRPAHSESQAARRASVALF